MAEKWSGNNGEIFYKFIVLGEQLRYYTLLKLSADKSSYDWTQIEIPVASDKLHGEGKFPPEISPGDETYRIYYRQK